MATKKKKLGAINAEESVNAEDLLQQLADLREQMGDASIDDRETLTQWERLIRRAMLVKNLYEHDAVKIILQFAQSKVDAIDEALRSQKAEDLANSQGLWKRAKMEASKEAFQWFVTIFTRAESTIKVINSSVKENLK